MLPTNAKTLVLQSIFPSPVPLLGCPGGSASPATSKVLPTTEKAHQRLVHPCQTRQALGQAPPLAGDRDPAIAVPPSNGARRYPHVTSVE